MCLTHCPDPDDGDEQSLIAINLAAPALLPVLLPAGVVAGHKFEYEIRAENETKAAQLADELARTGNERVLREKFAAGVAVVSGDGSDSKGLTSSKATVPRDEDEAVDMDALHIDAPFATTGSATKKDKQKKKNSKGGKK